MKTTRIFLIAISVLAVSACVTVKTPDGYAQRDRTGSYRYKAVSTDANTLSLRVQRNEDKAKGTLDFWTEAARKHMTLSRGYELKEEGKFVSDEGPGRWILFTRKYRGTDYLYLLGLVVDGRRIFVLEGGGEKDVFEPDVPKLVKAFGTLD